MKVLKFKNIKDPLKNALKKFSDCPWHFFDGVPDKEPDHIIWADLAITRIMSSGVSQDLISKVLKNVHSNDVEKKLKQLPVNFDLATSDENPIIYDTFDNLFAKLKIHSFSTARIAKVLVRKRPNLIPMLDKVVVGFLDDAAKYWANNENICPKWFLPVWNSWDNQLSPYLRMIREDLISNYDDLLYVRKEISQTPRIGVPKDASLLRIWEAIVWWEYYEVYK